MKAIIACAGKYNRFNQTNPGKLYPKHLAVIDGVPNIQRTVDLLKSIGIKDILICCSAEDRQAFTFTGCELIIGRSYREIDRFRNLFDHITDGTLVLYGDVVYDRFDLNQMVLGNVSRRNLFFGRIGSNDLTRKSYGELFSVLVGDAAKFISDTMAVAKAYETGLIARELGWEVYKWSENLPMDIEEPMPTANFVQVSKMTDDFDTYPEYEKLAKVYEIVKGLH